LQPLKVKQRRRPVGLEEKIAKIGNNLKNVIQSIVDPQQIREFARVTGFVKRFSSRFNGDEFVQLLIIESVDGEKNTLRGAIDTLGTIKKKSLMSIQALSKRMNSKPAVDLIERVFEQSLHIIMNQIYDLLGASKIKIKLLDYFPNIYLQDSTESLLDEALKNEFKGSGGGSGNGKGDASFKIDLIYEWKRKILSCFKLTDRREPDSVLGANILEIIEKGDLVIRDLGYSFIDGFKTIQEKGAYFLSRLHSSLNVYLNPSDTKPISLGTFLDKNVKKSGMFDTKLYISTQMLLCRLIAYRVSPEIEEERRKEYIKECKKKKRKVDKEYIKRLSFTIFITNVPSAMWSTEVVGTVYRLRWQVELIFKSWKSELKFDYLKGTNVFRVRCLIYARLTAILMMFTVYACIDKVTLEVLEKEISIHKVIDWLTKNGRFFRIVMKGFSRGLWRTLQENSKRILCKEKRKNKKTTRELLKLGVPFGCITV
jgi:hypothetical protein